jgi:surface protein
MEVLIKPACRDVRNTSMKFMFHKASSFNQPLNNWNVSKVTDMSGMFYSAKIFNQPLNKWDVSSVTDVNNMFK